MNRHGRRFIELRDFKSHAKSLNVKRLKDDELEFYEQHCLLLPAVVRHQPTAHLVAVTQRNKGWTVKNPEDLEPPEALRRLQRPHADGLHPFDAEREHNPLLLTPDCTCGCRKLRRGWSGGISVLVDESVRAGCLHDLEVSIWLVWWVGGDGW